MIEPSWPLRVAGLATKLVCLQNSLILNAKKSMGVILKEGWEQVLARSEVVTKM